MKNLAKRDWLFSGLIIIFSLLIFFPTFNLGFFGDDWLLFWIDKYFHGPQAYGHWSYLEHFFTRYGSQAVAMGLLKQIFGFNPTPFYIFSFICRLLAAFSLSPLIFYLTKNKAATLVGILFFSITTVGLETSEYLPHIPSYIGLIFFNLFLYFFLQSRDKLELKSILFSGLFFFLTFVMAPIRMTGLLPFILLFELFLFLQQPHKDSLLLSFKRTLFILLVFILTTQIGHPFFYLYQPDQTFQTENNQILNQTLSGFIQTKELLQSGKFDFLAYPIIIFGGMFLPDSLNLVSINTNLPAQLLHILTAMVLFLSIALFLLHHLVIRIDLKQVLIISVLWTMLSFFVYFANINAIGSGQRLISLLIGGYILFFTVDLIYKYKTNLKFTQGLFLSVSWAMLAFLIPWFWSPTTLFPTNQRYLIGSAVGVAIFLSLLFNQARLKKTGLILILPIIALHSIASLGYLTLLQNNHPKYLSQKLWADLPFIPQVKTGPFPTVFYFQADGKDSGLVHDVFTYGFPPHMDLTYDLDHPKGDNLPLGVSEWKDVVSATSDGQILVAFGYPKRSVPITQIYAFKIERDNLVDITTQVRDKLSHHDN